MSVSRRDEVRQYIEAKGEAQIAELQALFPDVSTMTIRRDLIRLEEDGFIKRTRGGAVAINRLTGGIEGLYVLRAGENVSGKLAIANAAVKLVSTGHSLYLDSGSTMMYFAKSLPEEHFPIVTSGLNIALELTRSPLFMVTVLGGQLNVNTISISGQLAMQSIQNINIDIAVMSTSGYDRDTGFTSGTHTENELKRAVIAKARRTILLMDHSKLGRSMPLTFARLCDIDTLVTDCTDETLRADCAANGVNYILAK